MGVDELVLTGTSGSRRDQPMEFIDSRKEAEAMTATKEALGWRSGRRTSRRTFALANAPSRPSNVAFPAMSMSMIWMIFHTSLD